MKKIGQHFISKLPPKKMSRGTPSTLSNPSRFFLKMMKQMRPLKKEIQKNLSDIKVFLKRMKQKRLHKVHPPSERRGTLILFNLIECGRLSFQVSPFLNTGIERQH